MNTHDYEQTKRLYTAELARLNMSRPRTRDGFYMAVILGTVWLAGWFIF